MVEVGAAGGRDSSQGYRLVGRPDEQRPPLCVGVQRDDRYVKITLLVQLSDRADQPHCGLAPIDHRHPSEHPAPSIDELAQRHGQPSSVPTSSEYRLLRR